MNKDLVSVIIPCYNSQQFIAEAIESVLAQDYPHVELIVIDDGSTDNSKYIIQSFGDQLTFLTQKNSGAPAARNKGLKQAKGFYIKFLDADDLLEADCLSRQVQQSKKQIRHNNYIVFGDVKLIDGKGDLFDSRKFSAQKAHEDIVEYILLNNPLTSSPLHRKEYLLQVNGFDINLHKGQEWDLHLRLALSGVEFIYQPGFVYRFREHHSDTRISQTDLSKHPPLTLFEGYQKQEALIRNHFNQHLPPKVKKYLAHKYWRYGRAFLRENNLEEAARFFIKAKDILGTHAIDGKFPYPFLVRLFGPVKAEQILEYLKNLKIPIISTKHPHAATQRY